MIEIEQVHTIGTLQDGRFVFSEVNFTKKEYDLQYRLKQCLFCNSSERRLEEFCEIRINEKLVPVPLPVFWASSRPKNCCQMYDTPNFSAALSNDKKCKLNDMLLFGQDHGIII